MQKRFIRWNLCDNAERYQVSYRLDGRPDYTLPSKIMADLETAANCCSYAGPFEHKRLDEERDSRLSLSLFVPSLMNGEILHRNLRVHNQSSRGFARVFQQQMFKQVGPLSGSQNLTFVKLCQFLDPCLSFEGTVTIGIHKHLIEREPTLGLSSGKSS